MASQLDELTDQVVKWAAHSEIADLVPEFVEQVNGELNTSLRTRYNTSYANLMLSSDPDGTLLPDDFLAARVIRFDGKDMEYVTPEQQLRDEPGPTPTYTIIGRRIRVHPLPQPREITRKVPFCYTLHGSRTMTVDENNRPVHVLRLMWTPDESQLEGLKAWIVVERVHRYTGAVSSYTIDDVGPAPQIVEITEALNRLYIYKFTYMTEKDRSNSLRYDNGEFEILETKYERTTFAIPELEMVYYHKLPPLSVIGEDGVETDRNVLYDTFPGLYLYGVLTHAHEYLMDGDKSAYWLKKYMDVTQRIITSDASDKFSGSTLRTRVR